MDIKQKENESTKDYVARVEQTTMLNLVALMERLKNAKDKDRDRCKKKQENKTHHRDRNRHSDSKVQGEGSRDKDRRERRVQNDTEDAKEETQDRLDMEKTKDEETEELIQTATEVRSRENRKIYTMQRRRGFYAVQILQQ